MGVYHHGQATSALLCYLVHGSLRSHHGPVNRVQHGFDRLETIENVLHAIARRIARAQCARRRTRANERLVNLDQHLLHVIEVADDVL